MHERVDLRTVPAGSHLPLADNPTVQATEEATVRAIRRASPELTCFQSRRQALVCEAKVPLEDAHEWAMRYQDTTEGMRFDVTQIELPLSAARLSALVKRALRRHPALNDVYATRGPLGRAAGTT